MRPPSPTLCWIMPQRALLRWAGLLITTHCTVLRSYKLSTQHSALISFAVPLCAYTGPSEVVKACQNLSAHALCFLRTCKL